MVKAVYGICPECGEQIKHLPKEKIIKCYRCLTLIDLVKNKINRMDCSLWNSVPPFVPRYSEGFRINRKTQNHHNLYKRMHLPNKIPSYSYFIKKVNKGEIFVQKERSTDEEMEEIKKELIKLYYDSGANVRNTFNKQSPTYKEIHAAAGVVSYVPASMGRLIATGQIKAPDLKDRNDILRFRKELDALKKVNQSRIYNKK